VGGNEGRWEGGKREDGGRWVGGWEGVERKGSKKCHIAEQEASLPIALHGDITLETSLWFTCMLVTNTEECNYTLVGTDLEVPNSPSPISILWVPRSLATVERKGLCQVSEAVEGLLQLSVLHLQSGKRRKRGRESGREKRREEKKRREEAGKEGRGEGERKGDSPLLD